jgi:hypothetical protein
MREKVPSLAIGLCNEVISKMKNPIKRWIIGSDAASLPESEADHVD